MLQDTYLLVVCVLSLVCMLALLVHHYVIHENLAPRGNCYRCFQPEDVCVPFKHHRCTHEIWVVCFAVIFTASSSILIYSNSDAIS